MSNIQKAIGALENLGLTEYEARCFTALSQLPHGTAKEVGQVADIPRSRVYETMERLQKRGLVELHDAEPRRYQSVSVDTAVDILRHQYESYFDTIEQSLRKIEPTYKKAAQAVWAINTNKQVTGRVTDLIEGAEDEIVLIVLDEALLDEAVLDSLAAAGERSVSINIGTVSDTVHERIEESGIVSTFFATDLIEWFTAMTGSPRLGRLLMVDREPTLVSALHEEDLPGIPNETAVWTDGIDHGFATFAERVLTFELKDEIANVYDSTESEE